MNDDTQHTISLSDIVNISYLESGTLLLVNMSNGTTQNYVISEIRKLTFGNTVGITEREIEMVKAFSILNNYPNPFNPSTTIAYELAEPTAVSINIYDAVGKFVKNIENSEKGAGYHSTIWNGKDEKGSPVSSGVYFYRLQTDMYVETRQMLLLK
jgi:flagellar hook assembly protein FlgD